jgi:acetolactate decarboxylase
MKLFTAILLVLIISFSCAKDQEPEMIEQPVLVQVSVIDALLQGFYDGFYALSDLKKHGSYGIGTFHALDGEMMMFNDTIYQIMASGEVAIPDDKLLTPFAAVSPLVPDTFFNVTHLDYNGLKSNFDQYFPTTNIFYVVKISGSFNYIKTRSVPAQTKPYVPLVEVTANQPEFEFSNIKGDIIGFYCPEFAKGVNVVGLHLHFLTSDRKGGGHLLDFELEQGTIEIGFIFDYKLILPIGGDFYGGDFSIDRTTELDDVEG